MKKIELLAPGGSFDAAIYALEAGADAVYCGMQNFSARNSAVNFTFDQLRRLKRYCNDNNKRLYITLNTIIKDDELSELANIIKELRLLSVDALIIQDFSIIPLIRELYPSVEIHGSTQMAVHNTEGLNLCNELTVNRVILPREITLKEISHFRAKVPPIELEIFIHGALCYSYSGLCLASGVLLNRSGNRGQCGQICRTWFSSDNNRGHFFSCGDLDLSDSIGEIIDAGVTSLKIEGRMKSPEYVRSVVSFYRKIIDKKIIDGDLKNRSTVSFARKKTRGYLYSKSGENLIYNDFPGHRGLLLGSVNKVNQQGPQIKLLHDISLRDGIQFYSSTENEMISTSVKGLLDRNGKKINSSKKDSTVSIICHHKIDLNAEVYLISYHDNKVKQLNENSYKMYLLPYDMKLIINGDGVKCSLNFFNREKSLEIPLFVEESKSKIKIDDIINTTFGVTGDYSLNSLSVTNESLFQYPYIPSSILKKAKREIRNNLDDIKKEYFSDYEFTQKDLHSNHTFDKSKWNKKRQLLNPQYSLLENESLIPFISEDHIDEPEKCSVVEDYIVMPLPPVIDDSDFFNKLRSLLVKSNKKYLLGINNISHLEAIKPLFKELKNVFYFCDIYCYISGLHSYEFYKSFIGENLLFGISWIEDDPIDHEQMISAGDDFLPPLFYSKGCFLKHNLNQQCKGCEKNKELIIENNNKKFIVIVYNCITYFFEYKRK